MKPKNDYRYIRAWCEMMGSYPHYTNEQVECAREDNAPPTSIYRGEGGHWRTFDQVENEETRTRIQAIIRRRHGR